MKQHAIDLMPPSIRARSQAGVRTGRWIIVVATIAAMLVVAITHSRLALTSAQAELMVIRSTAADVLAIDARADELRSDLDEARQAIEQYQKIALPLEISAVMSTIINALPESVTLDQFDLDAGVRMVGGARSPRSRGDEAKADPPRILNCEISGFAASDEHIAELVSRLESTPPFQSVNLDFSRTKKVHDRDAREFRLSFKVDLGARYIVLMESPEDASGHAGAVKGAADDPVH